MNLKSIKNKLFFLPFIFLAIVGGSIAFFSHQYSPEGNEIRELKMNGKVFHVEIVSDAAKLSKGLGERDSLCQDCGMFFEFPKPAKRSFWMKGMRFSIDILWVNGNEIVHVSKNVSQNSLDTISPDVLVDRVLEVNAGVADSLGIKEGTKLEF